MDVGELAGLETGATTKRRNNGVFTFFGHTRPYWNVERRTQPRMERINTNRVTADCADNADEDWMNQVIIRRVAVDSIGVKKITSKFSVDRKKGKFRTWKEASKREAREKTEERQNDAQAK